MRANDYFEGELQVQLVEAVNKEDIAKMKSLVAHGADVNRRGRDRITPLFWALGRQKKKSYQFLLEHGADPNFRTGKSPRGSAEISVMQIAAIAEDPDYLRIALEHGGNPNLPIGRASQTVIYDAIMNSRVKNVQALITAGVKLNQVDSMGQTPLVHAATANLYDSAYLLLKAGADPKIKNRWGGDLAALIREFGAQGLPARGGQRDWYERVVEDLRVRGLL